ncbi:MAG TPA: hypothetical protein VMT46_06040 [Anaerolineaceae bacterium]|nr:hypothetical protein [Anaerolineaceae bacterium]
MRITRETLLKLAQEAVAERVRANRGIVTAYVAGSVLTQEPLLGGTTDIDLFLIHDSRPPYEREIVRLSPEVHLDIVHHSQALYHQPRHLRTDLWLGSTLYFNPILLHDTQHWFEFTQSSVRSLFWQADNVMRRSRPLAEKARQTWMRLQTGERGPVEGFSLYLAALEAAADAIASLTGAPLSERRFLIDFSARAQAVEQAGLGVGLAGLLGQANIDVDTVRGWIPAWRAAFLEAGNQIETPVDRQPLRLGYYERAIEALLSSDAPQTALWPLLNTWVHSLTLLADGSEHLNAWEMACAALGFAGKDFQDRLAGLDAYLDSIEETLDRWGAANGVEASAA